MKCIICKNDFKNGVKFRLIEVNNEEAKPVFKNKIGDEDVNVCPVCGMLLIRRFFNEIAHLQKLNTIAEAIAEDHKLTESLLKKYSMPNDGIIEEILRGIKDE